MNNALMEEEFKDNTLISKYLKYMKGVLDIKESMDDWKYRNYLDESEYVKYKDRTHYDTHPTQKMHYEYLKEVFPEYDTIESKERYELSLNAVNTNSIQSQFEIYAEKILTPLNKAYWAGPKLFF
jgi:hypothetical protein